MGVYEDEVIEIQRRWADGLIDNKEYNRLLGEIESGLEVTDINEWPEDYQNELRR